MALQHVTLVEDLFAEGFLRWQILYRNLRSFSFLIPIDTTHQLGECLLRTLCKLMLGLVFRALWRWLAK